MDRRNFLRQIIQGSVFLPLAPTSAWAIAGKTIVVQESPIAGFQYYDGEEVFAELRVQTALLLEREQDNKYDANAVAIYYKQYKLGFVPKAENTAVAQMLDRGEYLSAVIVKLERSKNPWDRVRFQAVLDA